MQPLNWNFRLTGLLPWIVATVFIAGLVHIISILAMPRLATRDVYSRVAAQTSINTMQLLANDGPDAIPFEDPATVLAVCRYDLGAGALRLRGMLAGEGLVLISFRDRLGRAFFALTDRGTSRGRLDVVIATRSQLDAIQAQDAEDDVPSEMRLLARDEVGFIFIRALALDDSARNSVREKVQGFTCATQKPPAG